MTKVIILVVLFSSNCLSQQIKKITKPSDCNDIVRFIEINHKSVKPKNLTVLFAAFSDSICVSNVEFEEVGNELLFELINRDPKLFFETLFNLSDISVNAVKYQINHPVNDGINVIKIYKKIESLDIEKRFKKKVLSFLQYSYQSQVEYIKTWEFKNNSKWVFPN